ncbi:MAG: lactate utilization protein B [Candidatus Promineifilaceae bacterium]|nr:lactate utilization protein B [Candidatus Promineifilaceae bacterium]
MTAQRSSTVPEFRRRAEAALANERLQGALEGATGRFQDHRRQALAALPDADALRDHFKTMRAATLARLDEHLQTFERNASAVGARVHWARDGAEAGAIVSTIAAKRGVQLVAKTKSMATEEIRLNEALKAAGMTPVETDLGEWIIQLAEEPPFHIIAPAVHKTRAEVAELFSTEAGEPLPPDDIPRLTAAARRLLREKFLAAGLGITGANIGVAESGSIVLVTNEGNAEMVTSLPPVHVVVMGIEKIAPTWDDAAAWLALLARSATGQPLSIYTTVISGPARPEDPDGPEEVHIILLDNNRSQQLGTAYEEALQCIRCGACLNVCPVYKEAGGHAYGSPYSGPIGAVITPILFGLDAYAALPQASSLCGACLDVCPVRIDLPRMLLELRADEVEQRLLSWPERVAENAAAEVLKREWLLRWTSRLLRLLQRPFAREGHLRLPGSLSSAAGRPLPALAEKSFRQLWQEGALDE